MTHDSDVEKRSTSSTSRFKVTGVPESDVSGGATASTAFTPAVSQHEQQPTNSTQDAGSTTRIEEAEGVSKRPTTIPLDTTVDSSRRGSISEPASTRERVPSESGGSGGVGKVEGEQETFVKEGSSDLAGDAILDLKQELREGVSPLSRQSSKRDVDVDSEGSGTEEG